MFRALLVLLLVGAAVAQHPQRCDDVKRDTIHGKECRDDRHCGITLDARDEGECCDKCLRDEGRNECHCWTFYEDRARGFASCVLKDAVHCWEPSVFHNHAVSGRRPQLRGAHNSTHFRRDSPPVKVSAPPPPVHVGLLAGHSPAAWKDAPKEGTVDAVKQNLQVYAAAVATAAAAGVQLLLLPEAYGLWSSATKDGFWEPLSNSSTPCSGADASAQPMQKELACLAAKHGVALAYNGFVTRGGARRITEVVLDQKGALVATYDKVHLFPVTERAMGATAGVNAPVSFELLGRRWGVLICYEGVWPYTLDGNFKQMEALKAQGAGSWLWSIGSEIPIDIAAKKLAKKFGVKIAATEDKSTPSFADELICEGAVECKHVDTALPAITGYGAKAYVRSALL